jgi:hypothetical protein
MLGAHLFVSQAGLEPVSDSRSSPPIFLSVMWYGEAFYGLGVQGVKVLICFCVLFPPSVVPVPQQDF